jgi:hypothetical protein
MRSVSKCGCCTVCWRDCREQPIRLLLACLDVYLGEPFPHLVVKLFCGRVDHATYFVDTLRKEAKMLVRLEEMRLITGDVIEIAGKNKSYVLLWSSQPEDYGRGLIRIDDGYTRNNIGIGIDDKVTVRKVSVRNAEQVILAPTEGLNIIGLEEYLPQLLERRVLAKGDIWFRSST